MRKTISILILLSIAAIFVLGIAAPGPTAILVIKDPWFDVRAEGAVGDGITNDTVAIQAAIDAAEAAGGGVVFIPEGTFLTDSLDLKSNVHLIGLGREISILKLRSNNSGLLTAVEKTNIVIESLEIHGNNKTTSTPGADSTEAVGIYLDQCTNVHIRYCYIHDCYNIGIVVQLGDDTPEVRDIYIEDCEIADIGLRTGAFPGGDAAWSAIAVDGDGTPNAGGWVYIRRNKIHGARNTLLSMARGQHIYVDNNEIYDGDSNMIQFGSRARYGYARRNYIHTFTGDFGPATEGFGISVHTTDVANPDNESDFTFQDNLIVDSTRGAIYTQYAPRCLIQRNRCINIAQSSGQSAAAIQGNFSESKVEDNYIYNCNYRGIWVHIKPDANDISVCRNRIYTAGEQGIYISKDGAYSADTVIVNDNLAADCTLAGIIIGDCNFVLTGNIIYNCSQDGAGVNSGIHIQNSANGIAANNYIDGANHKYGIDFTGSGNVQVDNNVVPNFDTAPYKVVSGTAAEQEMVKIGTIAGGTDDERPIFLAGGHTGSFIADLLVLNGSDITQHDTDYETFDVQNKGAAGNGTTSLFATNPNTKATGGLDINAFRDTSLSPDQNQSITKGQALTFKKTRTNSGQGLDEMILVIRYLDY